jgi:hypothetical protein
MNIVVQGTKSFSDYQTFMRAMGVVLSSIGDDNKFNIYSAGPAKVNSFAAEFSNMSEAGLKARGIKVSFNRVPISFISERIDEFDHVIFFSKPNEPTSNLVASAELSDVDVSVFRY